MRKRDKSLNARELQARFQPAFVTDFPTSGGAEDSILGLTRIPDGFPVWEDAQGLMAAVRWGSQVTLGQRRARRLLPSYQQGWTQFWQSEMSVGLNPAALIGSQRKGEFVYGLANGYAGVESYEYGFRTNGNLFLERRYDNRNRSYEITSGSVGAGTAVRNFAISARDSQLFVEDNYPAVLWFLSGDTVGLWTDDGTPWAWHYVQAPPLNPPEGWTAQHRLKYPYYHYYQEYERPDTNATPPALVLPFGVEQPEMWWLAPQKQGRWVIHRAKWGAGNWVDARGWMSLAENSVLVDAIDDYNPDGHAFGSPSEVSHVGPFAGLQWNDSGIAFRVLRDRRRVNRLWLVVTTTQLDGDLWRGAWYAHSDDNGDTWTHPRRIVPALMDRGGFQGDYTGSMQLAMTDSGHIVAPIAATYEGDRVNAFVALNWGATGLGASTPSSIIFRKGHREWGL